MNSHHRGVYQPLMENVPIYDLSDEEVEEGERSRLPLLIVIALIVLAAFAGVVWLAYNQGVARGRASAIVIAAPEGPVRTAPDNAGGAPTPYTGLKVYSQPVPPDQEAKSTALAPQARPAPAVVASPPAQTAAVPAAPAQTAAPVPVRPTITEAPPIRLSPESPAAIAASPAPSAAQAAPPRPVAPPASVAATPKPPAVAAAPPATRPAVSGAAVLQIGAYETQDIAVGAWTAFKARHAGVVGTLSQDVQQVDLGAKGTWYRLRVGPFADRAAAAAACQKLKAEGATCFLAAP